MASSTRFDIDLDFEVLVPSTSGGSGELITGTVRAAGSTVVVMCTQPEVFVQSGLADPTLFRGLATMLAAHHTTVELHGPDGLIARLGDLRSPVTQRLVTRSKFIEIRASKQLVGMAGSALALRGGGRIAASLPVASVLPARSLLPLFPTFRRRSRRQLTTTHYGFGEGRPQLIFAFGDTAWDGRPPRTFDLTADKVTIGSSPECDLVIEGAEPFHAEIRHLQNDEYVLFPLAPVGTGIDPKYTSASWAKGGVILRTGARIQIADCRMAYFRKEYADHGRPFAGRAGGEWSHQRPQPPRTIYRRAAES